jgi:hypothetical protein
MWSVFVSLVVALRARGRSRAALHLEILALRHQLKVLERSRPRRLRLRRSDRLLWVWISRRWREWRTSLVIVKPETVIAWHRRGVRLFWTWKSQCRFGRPTVVPTRNSIGTMRRSMVCHQGRRHADSRTPNARCAITVEDRGARWVRDGRTTGESAR